MLYNIGLFHFLFNIFYTSVAVIYRNSGHVKYIYIGFLFVLAHWMFLKGECVIAYIYKKLKDPQYKLGETTESTDMIDFFGQSNYTTYIQPIIRITPLIIISVILASGAIPTTFKYLMMVYFILAIALLNFKPFYPLALFGTIIFLEFLKRVF